MVCALLPISGGLVPVPLGIAIALAAITFVWQRPAVQWRVLWPLFAWYLLHVVGMLWTTDLAFGLFDLQVKLGLVLLPIAAAAICTLRPGMVQRSMVAFTIGMGVAIMLSLWKGWGCYQGTGDPGCFAQSTFSYDLHPSYAAWYACWAMAWWGRSAVQGSGLRTRLASLVAVVVLFVFIIMLASKSGAIGALVVVVMIAVWWLRRLAPRYWALGLGGAVAVLVSVLVLSGGGLVMDRMRAASDAMALAINGDQALYASEGGSEMRLVAWQCSVELLTAHAFGSGTGDVKHALVACYEEKGAHAAVAKRLNAHSQFLQGGVALGWPGLLLSFLIALVPLWQAIKRSDMLLGLFAVLFLLNAAVESVLEVQAGVVLMGIMLGLLAADRTSQLTVPASRP